MAWAQILILTNKLTYKKHYKLKKSTNYATFESCKYLKTYIVHKFKKSWNQQVNKLSHSYQKKLKYSFQK